MSSKRIALILAGGSGKRLGLPFPKQFAQVNGKTIIETVIHAFDTNASIDSIYVACVREWIEELNKILASSKWSKPIVVFPGGETGLQSARNGVITICEDGVPDDSLVLIHDAARPFVSQEIINDCISVAEKNGCAVAALPLAETLLLISEGSDFSKTVVPRNGLRRVQTPQAFHLATLRSLYEKATILDAESYPSTFALFVAKGGTVWCSLGEEANIKITFPSDLKYGDFEYANGQK